MKRAVKALFIAVYFAVLIYIFVGMALSGYVDFDHMNIYFGEVPEGTAFADILLKDSSDELRLDLDINTNFNYCALVGLIPDFDIGENSEIVRYNEDDYRSLMFNHTDYGSVYLEGLEIAQGENDDYMCFGGYTQPILKHFRHIKVAYCDKDGNILGITKEIKVKKTPLNDVTYEIKADGDELRCRFFKAPKYYLLALVLWAAVLFAVCAAVIIIKEKIAERQSAKMRIPIQSGEADNESKKQD